MKLQLLVSNETFNIYLQVEDRNRKYEDKFLEIFGKQEKIDHRRGIYFISNKNFKKKI